MKNIWMAHLILFLALVAGSAIAQSKSGDVNIPAACPSLPKPGPKPKKNSTRTSEQIEADKLISAAQALTPLSRENVVQALALLEQAVKADPGNAQAYTSLARAHINSTRYVDVPGKVAAQHAWMNLQKALTLAPDLVDALRLSGDRSIYHWRDYKCAERAYQRALGVEPQDARVHFDYAQLLGGIGKFDLAFEHADKALTYADAGTRNALLSNSGRLRFMARQFDWVLTHYDKFLVSNPNAPVAHFYRGLAYAQKGDYQEALTEHKLAASFWKGDAGAVAALARAYAQAGQKNVSREILKELLERDARGEHVVEYQIAGVYEALGDVNETFRWLNKAVDDKDGVTGWLLWLGHDPRWDRLRQDDRFKEVLKRAGLK